MSSGAVLTNEMEEELLNIVKETNDFLNDEVMEYVGDLGMVRLKFCFNNLLTNKSKENGNLQKLCEFLDIDIDQVFSIDFLYAGVNKVSVSMLKNEKTSKGIYTKNSKMF